MVDDRCGAMRRAAERGDAERSVAGPSVALRWSAIKPSKFYWFKSSIPCRAFCNWATATNAS